MHPVAIVPEPSACEYDPDAIVPCACEYFALLRVNYFRLRCTIPSACELFPVAVVVPSACELFPVAIVNTPSACEASPVAVVSVPSACELFPSAIEP
jgi:hypothetical protein